MVRRLKQSFEQAAEGMGTGRGSPDMLDQNILMIKQAFHALPAGAILWHGTLNKRWAYDPARWLSTSTSRTKAYEAAATYASQNKDLTPLLIKLKVAAPSVTGLPCQGKPGKEDDDDDEDGEVYPYQEDEVLISQGRRLHAYPIDEKGVWRSFELH